MIYVLIFVIGIVLGIYLAAYGASHILKDKGYGSFKEIPNKNKS